MSGYEHRHALFSRANRAVARQSGLAGESTGVGWQHAGEDIRQKRGQMKAAKDAFNGFGGQNATGKSADEESDLFG
jgi:hypothetical protein